MKIERHHIKHVRLTMWKVLIALLGLVFALEILHAHEMSAYLDEEARLLNQNTYNFQASESIR